MKHELRGSLESYTHDWAEPVYEAWDATWPGIPPFEANPWLYPHGWLRVRLLPRSADNGPSSPAQEKQVIARTRAVLAFLLGVDDRFTFVARSTTWSRSGARPRRADPVDGALRRALHAPQLARDTHDLQDDESYSWEHHWHTELTLETLTDEIALVMSHSWPAVLAATDLRWLVFIDDEKLDVVFASTSAREKFEREFTKWLSSRREWVWPRPKHPAIVGGLL